MTTTELRPFRAGTLLAVTAGVAFGVTAPLTQRFGRGVGPFTTAALLYLGAGAASIARRAENEAAVRSRHLGRIVLAATAGAFVAPVCLAFGLQRATGTAASLMLNVEAVFTVLLAAALLHEHVGHRAQLATAAMVAGGMVLVAGTGLGGTASATGLAAIAFATLCWAVDNVVLRPLAELDSARVVLWKAAFGVALSLGAAILWGESRPAGTSAVALVACGATGYGMSLRLYLQAQRRIGAGRTGSLFSLAPFVGAVVAFFLGQGTLGSSTLPAAALFALGAYLHATERHAHRHTHEPIEHEHAHRHDDAHHDHVHEPAVMGEHSHLHRHGPMIHEHAHAPDVHHAHTHRSRKQT